MALPNPSITAAEPLAMESPADCRYELLDGELHRVSPPGARHGWLAARLARLLGNHAETGAFGRVFVETGFVLARDPDRVRAPDVSFVRTDRLAFEAGYVEGVPDLCFEVMSPSDSRPRAREKAADWLRHGCPCVVVVDSERHRVEVWRPGSEAVVLEGVDEFRVEEILPGFRFSVAELFAG